ncbi:MAG TPA: hypothetical protein VF658_13415 [Pyrinomonadaceae bacterium]|jgi:hypothetical protein
MTNNSVLSKSTGRTVTQLLILLAALSLLAIGCSKADNTNNSNASSTNKTSTNSTTATSSTPAASSSSSTASSPIAAYKAFQEANRKKDYAAVKSRMSKASLEILTEQAKKQNKTLDEFIKDQVDKGTSDEEVLNEKIDGDNATVELKDNDSSATLPMVKEDGEWKIAYDRLFKQLQEAFDKMNKAAPKPPATNQNSGNENDNEED